MGEAETLLLWRWSTIVQLTSLAMATAFFALLARSSRRAELHSWMGAWLANFLALLVTSLYWLLQPVTTFPIVSALYFGFKTLFVVLLIRGVWMMTHRGDPRYSALQITIGIVLYSVVTAVLVRGINNVGIWQHTVIAVALLAAAAGILRSKIAEMSWLAVALGLRGTLAAAECGAYLVREYKVTSGAGGWLDQIVPVFLATSSSFDTAAEWLLVLGCVLAVSDRGRRELQNANQDLIAAQEDLRRLVDRDPLTALINRRSLPEIFRAVQPNGALLLFFDLDDFKKINDRHGHAAGDACLKLFAAALRDSFRPGDHVIRYGGDEFLVVADGLDTPAARDRVDEVRRRMQRTGGGELVCRFSVGMAEMPPGGQPEAALEAADAQMYKAKHQVIA